MYIIMLSHKYIFNSSKYSSYKTSKLLLFIHKKKHIIVVKYRRSIFECDKHEILKCTCRIGFYKITKNIIILYNINEG